LRFDGECSDQKKLKETREEKKLVFEGNATRGLLADVKKREKKNDGGEMYSFYLIPN